LGWLLAGTKEGRAAGTDRRRRRSAERETHERKKKKKEKIKSENLGRDASSHAPFTHTH
jgi:hypothetical protein